MIFHHNDLIDAKNKLKKGKIEESKKILEKHLDEISGISSLSDLKYFDNLIRRLNDFYETIVGFRGKFVFDEDKVGRILDYSFAGVYMSRLLSENFYPKIIKAAHEVAKIVSKYERKTK
ncbi:MAG: hypothetical protein KAS15_08500 [Nanoarchaeota archaeon]|nr:hypothetical protein [Nanoarchaeota archaeon]